MNSFLRKGSATRHVATLVSGTAIGQLAVVAVSPILTRLYTPEEFGVLAIYAAMFGIIGIVAGLRYELAIPLPRTDGSAANLLILNLICVFLTTVLLTIATTIFYNQIPQWFNTPGIASYLWLLPLGVFLRGIYQSFNYWAIRRESFSRIARTTIQQGVGGSIAQVILGLANLGPIGLITGQIIGQSAGLITLISGAYNEDRSLIKRLKKQRIYQLARRYSRFPKFTTWQAMANTASTMLPLILFAALLSPSVAGLYMLAHRTLYMPLALIGRSVGQVFHSRAATARREGTLDQLTLKTFQHLLRIGMGPLVFIGILAPDLFAMVFGDSWRQAGIYAQWMVPWLVVQFVVSPISVVISVTENQFGGLLSQTLFLTIRISALLIGEYLIGGDGAVFFYAFSGLVLYGGLWIWMASIVHLSVARWGSCLWPVMLQTGLYVTLALAIKWIFAL